MIPQTIKLSVLDDCSSQKGRDMLINLLQWHNCNCSKQLVIFLTVVSVLTMVSHCKIWLKLDDEN